MNTSITQNNQIDNQISKSVRRFFTRFHLSSALKTAGLKTANAYKKINELADTLMDTIPPLLKSRLQAV